MTISTTNRKAGPYAGDDATTSFAFAFKVFADTDLRVVQYDADGVETDLVLDTDFTATINAVQDTDPGGTVLLGTALPTGEQLVITSARTALQSLSLQNGGAFNPENINDTFDHIIILLQQLTDRIDRTIVSPVLDDLGVLELPSALARAGKVLVFDASGVPSATTYSLVTVSEGDIIGIPADGSVTLAKLAADVHPAAVAGLTNAANKLMYGTGAGNSYALADLTTFGRSVIACANEAALVALLTSLGLSAYAALAGATFTGPVNLSYTSGGVSAAEAGFRGLPANIQNGAYSFVKDDMGRCVRHTDAGAVAYTIEPNSTSAIPGGAIIPVRNFNGAGIITLTKGAGVTLRQAGSGTDANLALAANGWASLWQETTDVWVASGVGLS